MSDPVIVVLEKRPRWTPELQRQLQSQRVAVKACRSVADVRERIGGWRDSRMARRALRWR